MFEGGLPVEVQIRTELQDLWAQVFERLADRWGRAIRYGGELDEPDAVALGSDPPITRRELVEFLRQLGDRIDKVEQARVEVHDVADDQAPATNRAGHVVGLTDFESSIRRMLPVLMHYATEEA